MADRLGGAQVVSQVSTKTLTIEKQRTLQAAKSRLAAGPYPQFLIFRTYELLGALGCPFVIAKTTERDGEWITLE